MFKGEYNHTIDTKGRVIIPAKFRDKLGEAFVITKGLDGCLYGYANEDWQVFEDKLSSLSITNKDSRQFTRFFLAGAADCEVDKQGRILIPSVLREFAGLEKDVVLVGVSRRIEIWNKEKWSEITAQYDDNMDEIAANLDGLGFSIQKGHDNEF